MSEEIENEDIEEETGVGEIAPAGPLNFLVDPKHHSLAKAQRQLNKEIKGAIEFLSNTVSNDQIDTKTRLDAAKTLIDKAIQVNTEINRESLSRLTLQAKQMMMSQQSTMKNIRRDDNSSDDDEDETPKVMFIKDKIVDVSNIDNL